MADFPRANLNPAAQPWARRAQKIISDQETALQQLQDKVAAQARIIAAAKAIAPGADGTIYRPNGIVVPPAGDGLIYASGVDGNGNPVSIVTGRESATPYTLFFGESEDDTGGSFSALQVSPESVFLRNNMVQHGGYSAVLAMQGGSTGGTQGNGGGGTTDTAFDGYETSQGYFGVEFGTTQNQSVAYFTDSPWDASASRWAIRYQAGTAAPRAGGFTSYLSLADGLFEIGVEASEVGGSDGADYGFAFKDWMRAYVTLDGNGSLVRTLELDSRVTLAGWGTGGGGGGGSNLADAYTGPWDGQHHYNRGDAVDENGIIWVALKADIGTPPGTQFDVWTAFAVAADHPLYSFASRVAQLAPWDNTTTFDIEDLVTYEGNAYVAINQSQNRIPGASDTQNFWRLVPGSGGGAGGTGFDLAAAYIGHWQSLPGTPVQIRDAGYFYDATPYNDTPSTFGGQGYTFTTSQMYQGTSPDYYFSPGPNRADYSQITSFWWQRADPNGPTPTAGTGGFVVPHVEGAQSVSFNIKSIATSQPTGDDQGNTFPGFGVFDYQGSGSRPHGHTAAYTDEQGVVHPEIPKTVFVTQVANGCDWTRLTIPNPQPGHSWAFYVADPRGGVIVSELEWTHTGHQVTVQKGQIVDFDDGGTYLALQTQTTGRPVDTGLSSTYWELLGYAIDPETYSNPATEFVAGVIRIATSSEVSDGTDDATAVSPAHLREALSGGSTPTASDTTAGIIRIATEPEAEAGADDTIAMTPSLVASEITRRVPNGDSTTAGLLRLATDEEATDGISTSTAMTPAEVKAAMAAGAYTLLVGWKGTYDPTVTYNPGDLVRFNGALVLSLSINSGTAPPVALPDTADWAVIVAKPPTGGGTGGGNGPLVVGPTNSLTMPGLWLQTDNDGNFIQWLYDDHNGVGGSNTNGAVSFGPTNGLQQAGLWIQTDENLVPQMLVYDDGNH